MPAGPLTESAPVPGSGWRFVPGHPLGIPQGFVLGSAWSARNWEGWGYPCQPSSPELRDPSHSAPCMAPHPAVSWCHPGRVAGGQCRVRGHWGAGFAHGCLLTICKCKKRPRGGRGHPAHRGCLHSGRGPAQVEGPPLPGTPRAPLGSFPWPRGQLGPEQTGLFAHAGISCSLCSFDFLFPLCHILLWGLQRGLGPPRPAPGSPGLLPIHPPALH